MKPWFFLDPVPYKKLYWRYLKKTPWKDYEYPDLNLKGFFERAAYIIKTAINKFRSWKVV